jgi:predicted nucleic acid-binding protein
MLNKALFVDCSVIMEIYNQRQKSVQCQQILYNYDYWYISFTTILVIYFFMERDGRNLYLLERFLSKFDIITCSQSTYDKALKLYHQEDIDDALGVAACLEYGIGDLFTLDKKLITKYSKEIKNIHFVTI